jgi:hypothetical protein
MDRRRTDEWDKFYPRICLSVIMVLDDNDSGFCRHSPRRSLALEEVNTIAVIAIGLNG